jgi:hypothetical protein
LPCEFALGVSGILAAIKTAQEKAKNPTLHTTKDGAPGPFI